jgi:hypothetical protein
LNKELDGAIEGFFFISGKIAGRKLVALAMVMQTFATKTTAATTGEGAIAILGVDLDAGTLVEFAHENLRSKSSWRFLMKIGNSVKKHEFITSARSLGDDWTGPAQIKTLSIPRECGRKQKTSRNAQR